MLLTTYFHEFQHLPTKIITYFHECQHLFTKIATSNIYIYILLSYLVQKVDLVANSLNPRIRVHSLE